MNKYLKQVFLSPAQRVAREEVHEEVNYCPRRDFLNVRKFFYGQIPQLRRALHYQYFIFQKTTLSTQYVSRKH